MVDLTQWQISTLLAAATEVVVSEMVLFRIYTNTTLHIFCIGTIVNCDISGCKFDNIS